MKKPNREIRAATVSDASEIAKVHIQSWHETYADLLGQEVMNRLSIQERTERWRRILSSPQSWADAVTFVCEEEDQIAAFSTCGIQRTSHLKELGYTGEYHGIYVLKKFQGVGIGKQLMWRMSQSLIERGHTAASLTVLVDNHNACGFYAHMAGVPITLPDSISNKGYSEIAYGWDPVPIPGN